MEAMVQEWTDGRLDELSGKVDKGFENVGRRFEQVDRRFEQVDRRFEKVDADIGGLRREMGEMRTEINGRLDSLQRVMIQAIIALTAAMLTGFVGICGVLAATL
jgi:archaellum component FlaC